MKNYSKKIMALMVSVIMIVATAFPSAEVLAIAETYASTGDYAGKIVILHTNDVHGAIDGYANLVQLKKDYEGQGAEVILADAGDFSQGSVYVSANQGKNAADILSQVKYDVITFGNHEFDYGIDQLKENMSEIEAAGTKVVCSNVLNQDGTTLAGADKNTIITTESGIKLGFFGILSPETQTSTNPINVENLSFLTKDTATTIYQDAQNQINNLKENGATIVIGLTHLGIEDSVEPYRSTDLYQELTGCDFIIDGHSHSTVTATEELPIQQTGTSFENIGKVVIDKNTNTINYSESGLLSVGEEATGQDEAIKNTVDGIKCAVDTEYGEAFAKSLVDLNGNRSMEKSGTLGNRDSETNLGDLIADAMRWYGVNTISGIDPTNTIAIQNGGGIRAGINAGDVSMKDILQVLPFTNSLCTISVKGSELLETLEASTFSTPGEIGAFPQTSGIEFAINTSAEYDKQDEPYPESTYYGPNEINRVTIISVNGYAFDPNETYTVVTNDFIAAGGDTYYQFKNATTKVDTGKLLSEAVQEYISTELGGTIDERYASPQGRTHIVQEMARICCHGINVYVYALNDNEVEVAVIASGRNGFIFRIILSNEELEQQSWDIKRLADSIWQFVDGTKCGLRNWSFVNQHARSQRIAIVWQSKVLGHLPVLPSRYMGIHQGHGCHSCVGNMLPGVFKYGRGQGHSCHSCVGIKKHADKFYFAA